MAGQYYTGTLLASPIVRGSSGDTYGTHQSVLGVGGYMELGTLAERNALPVDGIAGTIYYDGLSSGQRRLGMLVHVLEDDTIYQLHPKTTGGTFYTYSQWMPLPNNQKYNLLADNLNSWFPLLSTGSGATNMGENISKSFAQTTHGFIVGDVIGYNGTIYQKVDPSTATTIEPLGIVSKVTGLNDFTLTYSGYISTAGIKDYSGNTLTSGTMYYLSAIPSFSGRTNMLPTPPTGLTNVSKPMLVSLLSGNTGVVLQYRGTSQTQQGVTLGDFYTYTANTQQFLDKTVTGGTNIGFFNGMTGVQTINILTSTPAYNGQYTSIYNNYYRDVNGFIQLGTPTYNGILRRGYVSDFTPKKSWLYNIYTGSSNQVGWILVDGDISTSVGTFLTANNVSANAGTPVYTEAEFSYTGGTGFDGYYTNSAVSLDVNGSFYTGTTYTIGGPVYSDKQYQELRFRTIMTNSPNAIKITYDDSFVYISGVTTTGSTTGVTTAANVGTGVGIFKSKTGSTLQFKSLIGSGGTTVQTIGDNIYIVGSGGSGGGTYNLASPSVIPVGGICTGTALTGKTSFELFEMLLVPELCGAITAPSTSIGLTASGLYEIGCILSGGSSQTVTGTFSRGSINPQYCSISAFRSGCANAYCFIGCGMPSGFQACSLSSASQTNSCYVVSAGTQSWSVKTRYAAGSPALGSKGTQYCAALPSGSTSGSSSIIGAYPLFATSSGITFLTKQTLVNMSTANNILVNLVAETGGTKQKFEIPCAWLTAPRPLVGVCQWNTVSSQWEYPGGSAGCSLNVWTTTGSTQTIQGNSIGYCQYKYNSVDRSSVCIRLVF